MAVQYNLVQTSTTGNITVVVEGEMYTADDNHPNWDVIVDKALSNDDSVVDDFDLSPKIADRFESLSERVSVANSRVYVDGDEVEGGIADQIARFYWEGVADWEPLVHFLEKVWSNPTEHSRENLSRWINATNGLTIDVNGDIVGYKGLTKTGGSITQGPAVVNGQAVEGSVPNAPGSVVEMARSKVTHDPAVGCSVGLHVGTWEYAKIFASERGSGIVAKVVVNPRDVVSVPTECGDKKMRVCRYKVVEYVDSASGAIVEDDNFVPSEDYLSYNDYEDAYGATDEYDYNKSY